MRYVKSYAVRWGLGGGGWHAWMEGVDRDVVHYFASAARHLWPVRIAAVSSYCVCWLLHGMLGGRHIVPRWHPLVGIKGADAC